MSFIVKRRGLKTSQNGGKTDLTPAMFLGKEGDVTYITPQLLMDFVNDGRVEDVEGIENLFLSTQNKSRMVYTRKVRIDASGLEYVFLNFYRRNAVEGVKVVLIDNMRQFIEDYSNGKFAVNFTLEDLITEAEQA